MHNIGVGATRLRLAAGIANQRDQALDAHGEATGRRGPATKLADQPIVATTGTDCALRTKPVGDPLENGEVVVVQPAHQAWVDLERQSGVAQDLLNGIEMLE